MMTLHRELAEREREVRADLGIRPEGYEEHPGVFETAEAEAQEEAFLALSPIRSGEWQPKDGKEWP